MPSWKKVILSGSDAALNSLDVTTNVTATSFTGSLLGTASFADQALSSSFAITASYASNVPLTASYALTASFVTGSSVYGPYGANSVISSSHAETASYSSNLVISGSINNVNYIDFTITNGTLVRLNGSQGDVPTVERAQSIAVSGSVNLLNQILGVATHNIEAGTFGYITTQGLVRGLNTNAFNDGDTLFVGTGSAGVIQNVAPRAPYEIIPIGVCVKASPGGSGIIYVAVQEPIDFSDLSSALVQGTYSYGDLWTYVPSGSFGVWKHTNQLSGSYAVTGSWRATSFTGSLLGTASYAICCSSFIFFICIKFISRYFCRYSFILTKHH